MAFDFDQSIDRRNTASYKWDYNGQLFGRSDILPFWVADMDFACPEPIMEAIKRRAEHPIFGYGIRTEAYHAAVLGWLEQRHGWRVPEGTLMFNPPGAVHAINTFVQLLTELGDEVVVQTPSYTPLFKVIEENGRVLVRNPLTLRDGCYGMDFGRLEDEIGPRTKLLILCSPHNPTGRVWREEELTRLATICRQHGMAVISDEVHSDLIYPGGRHVPFGSLPGGLADRSITVISPSKTFNTSGLPQCSVIIQDPTIREDFAKLLDVSQLNLDNLFGDVAMVAGYTHCGAWLDALMIYIEGNFHHMEGYLAMNVSGIRCTKPEGTFLAWLDFRSFDLVQDELVDRLVNRGRVGLYSGLEFGAEGDGFFRINLACPRALLEQGLVGIRKAMTLEQ